jgi:hypothetical protein
MNKLRWIVEEIDIGNGLSRVEKVLQENVDGKWVEVPILCPQFILDKVEESEGA